MGQQPALRIAAAAHADPHRMPLHPKVHRRGPVQTKTHRPPGSIGQQRGNRLDGEFVLAAIRTPDRRTDRTHPIGCKPQHGRDHLLVARRVLAAEGQDQSALPVGFGHTGLGFEIRRHLMSGLIVIVDHHRAGCEGLREVAARMSRLVQQIAGDMNRFACRLQGSMRIIDDRQQLVVHDDALHGSLRLGQGIGGHRRHRIADAADLVGAQHRSIDHPQAVMGDARNIGRGDHRMHARQLARRLRVDREDPGMRMRTAQDGTMQMPGAQPVAEETGIARQLRRAVGARLGGAQEVLMGHDRKRGVGRTRGMGHSWPTENAVLLRPPRGVRHAQLASHHACEQPCEHRMRRQIEPASHRDAFPSRHRRVVLQDLLQNLLQPRQPPGRQTRG